MKYLKDDKVIVAKPNRKEYPATVVKAGKAKAKVRRSDGKTRIVSLKYLKKETSICRMKDCGRPAAHHGYCKICWRKVSAELPPVEDKRKEFRGMGIKWNKEITNFNLETDNGIRFYGWVRKSKFANTEAMCWVVDMWSVYEGKEFMVDPVVFTVDPMLDPPRLNKRILARASEWYVSSLHKNVATLDRLQKVAEHPRIHIKRLETLDRVILKLREFRDIAIRAGGTRLFEMRGDNDSEPIVHVIVNLTMQAMGLKGKVPSLRHGALFDAATEGGREKDRKRVGLISNIPESANVKELIKMLRDTKDPVEARKIRALMRKMGHKGGSRNIKE